MFSISCRTPHAPSSGTFVPPSNVANGGQLPRPGALRTLSATRFRFTSSSRTRKPELLEFVPASPRASALSARSLRLSRSVAHSRSRAMIATTPREQPGRPLALTSRAPSPNRARTARFAGLGVWLTTLVAWFYDGPPGKFSLPPRMCYGFGRAKSPIAATLTSEVEALDVSRARHLDRAAVSYHHGYNRFEAPFSSRLVQLSKRPSSTRFAPAHRFEKNRKGAAQWIMPEPVATITISCRRPPSVDGRRAT